MRRSDLALLTSVIFTVSTITVVYRQKADETEV